MNYLLGVIVLLAVGCVVWKRQKGAWPWER